MVFPAYVPCNGKRTSLPLRQKSRHGIYMGKHLEKRTGDSHKKRLLFPYATRNRQRIYISPPKTQGIFYISPIFSKGNLQKVLVDKPVETANKFWENESC
jgi:hypothetical protein